MTAYEEFVRMNQPEVSEKSNSHIQMPKCALKKFENKHHKFFYIMMWIKSL